MQIGLLGAGYLGQKILLLGDPIRIGWVGIHQEKPQKENYFYFQWENKKTWKKIPKGDVYLVITIPPVLLHLLDEINRLELWCQWMNLHRSNIKKLTYISSTAVYPDQDGIWDEEKKLSPTSVKGKLRLATEKILSKYFRIVILRPGGIYGPGRNVARRILEKKKMLQGNKPIYRIHVKDLARIVLQCEPREGKPCILNAVDIHPSSMLEVARWLVQHHHLSNNYQIQEITAFPKAKKRVISNKKLIEEWKFKFEFPTFKRGLGHPDLF